MQLQICRIRLYVHGACDDLVILLVFPQAVLFLQEHSVVINWSWKGESAIKLVLN